MFEMLQHDRPHTLERIVAILDIEGGSAGMVLARSAREVPLQVLAERRVHLPVALRDSSAALMRLLETIDYLGNELLPHVRSMPHVVDTAYIILRAPFAATRIIQRAAYEGKDVLVTRDFINTVATNALAHDTEVPRDHFIEGRVMGIDLNGYRTGNPLGQSAHTIALSLLVSETAPEVRQALRTAVERLFPVAQMQWRSGARTLVTASQAFQGTEDFILADMTRDATAFTLVRNNAARTHARIPFGTHALLSQIEAHVDSSADDTADLMRLYEKGMHASSLTQQMQHACVRADEVALPLFSAALSALSSDTPLPKTVRTMAPAEGSLWLSRFLARPEFFVHTRTIHGFHASPMHPDDFFATSQLSASLSDVALAAACSLVHKEFQNAASNVV